MGTGGCWWVLVGGLAGGAAQSYLLLIPSVLSLPPGLWPPAVEMDRTKHYLVHTGVCDKVHHKEQYVPQKELDGECGVGSREWMDWHLAGGNTWNVGAGSESRGCVPHLHT